MHAPLFLLAGWTEAAVGVVSLFAPAWLCSLLLGLHDQPEAVLLLTRVLGAALIAQAITAFYCQKAIGGLCRSLLAYNMIAGLLLGYYWAHHGGGPLTPLAALFHGIMTAGLAPALYFTRAGD